MTRAKRIVFNVASFLTSKSLELLTMPPHLAQPSPTGWVACPGPWPRPWHSPWRRKSAPNWRRARRGLARWLRRSSISGCFPDESDALPGRIHGDSGWRLRPPLFRRTMKSKRAFSRQDQRCSKNAASGDGGHVQEVEFGTAILHFSVLSIAALDVMDASERSLRMGRCTVKPWCCSCFIETIVMGNSFSAILFRFPKKTQENPVEQMLADAGSRTNGIFPCMTKFRIPNRK